VQALEGAVERFAGELQVPGELVEERSATSLQGSRSMLKGWVAPLARS
jgi:hypothetical protein